MTGNQLRRRFAEMLTLKTDLETSTAHPATTRLERSSNYLRMILCVAALWWATQDATAGQVNTTLPPYTTSQSIYKSDPNQTTTSTSTSTSTTPTTEVTAEAYVENFTQTASSSVNLTYFFRVNDDFESNVPVEVTFYYSLSIEDIGHLGGDTASASITVNIGANLAGISELDGTGTSQQSGSANYYTLTKYCDSGDSFGVGRCKWLRRPTR
jgi:hypothetical protein